MISFQFNNHAKRAIKLEPFVKKQCCGSALASMRIRIQGFDEQKLKKIYR